MKPNGRTVVGPLIGRHGLSVRHLEIFWAVMRTGSQSEAAELLGISQPAVSKMIAHIEQRTALTLFFRSRGKLIPSDEAHVFYQSLEQIFEQAYKTDTLLDDLRHRAAGEISVAFSPGIGSRVISRFIEEFRSHLPLARVRVKFLPASIIVERTIRREIDVGVFNGPVGDVSVSSTVLIEHAVICLLPRGHALCAEPVITPQMLRTERILSGAYTDPSTWIHGLRDAFHSQNVDFRASIECVHSHQLHEFVANGLGIALCPPLPFFENEPEVVVKPFEPHVDAPLFAVMPVGRPTAQATSLLIQCMKKVLSPGSATD